MDAPKVAGGATPGLNVPMIRAPEALTENTPYPSCHANAVWFSSPLVHFDDSAFTTRIRSGMTSVGFSPMSKWTWSPVPPTA